MDAVAVAVAVAVDVDVCLFLFFSLSHHSPLIIITHPSSSFPLFVCFVRVYNQSLLSLLLIISIIVADICVFCAIAIAFMYRYKLVPVRWHWSVWWFENCVRLAKAVFLSNNERVRVHFFKTNSPLASKSTQRTVTNVAWFRIRNRACAHYLHYWALRFRPVKLPYHGIKLPVLVQLLWQMRAGSRIWVR